MSDDSMLDISNSFPTYASGNFQIDTPPLEWDKSHMSEWLKNKIRDRLDQLGKNPFEVAKEAGLERGYVNDILIGKKSSLRGPGLAKLAQALRVTPDFLANENAEIRHDSPLKDGELVASEILADVVNIPQVDVRFGMGGGAIYDLPVEATPLQFSKSWLNQITSSRPDDLFWATGFGDSMYPTIGDMDIVLIDTSQRIPRIRDQIWALNQYGQGMIKRLRSTPDGYLIMSDNAHVQPETAVDGSMDVIGRVVAIVRRI